MYYYWPVLSPSDSIPMISMYSGFLIANFYTDFGDKSAHLVPLALGIDTT